MGSADILRTPASSPARDLYDVLGVDSGADADEIRAAYRRLARELHPDVSVHPDSEERFRELTAAHAVLSDPKTRALYDRFGHYGPGSWLRADGTQPAVVAEVDIDAFEAERGARRAVRYSAQAPCPACFGQGSAPGSRPRRCDACSGKGSLTRSSSLGVGDWLQVEACADCGGTGILRTPCAACAGSGYVAREERLMVRIPPGVEDGARLRVVGGAEHLRVQVRPLPEDSKVVRLVAAALLLCALGLLAYFLTL